MIWKRSDQRLDRFIVIHYQKKSVDKTKEESSHLASDARLETKPNMVEPEEEEHER